MGVVALFRRLDRRLARFNKWLAPAAVAANTENQGPAPSIDPMRV